MTIDDPCVRRTDIFRVITKHTEGTKELYVRKNVRKDSPIYLDRIAYSSRPYLSRKRMTGVDSL